MGITSHIILILGVTALIVATCTYYGRKPPSALHVLSGFGVGVAATVIMMVVTSFGIREGTNPITLMLLLLCGDWAFWTFIESPRRVLSFCALLFMIVFYLKLEHISLANTMRYTDNPDARLTSVRDYQKNGRYPKGVQVNIQAAWHTWLTQLYELDPPAPGGGGFTP